ncbi:hypothetical protein AVEN_64254-1 [Araneus ventricosus]|uniref:Uncharacterized protein n=1 Tax=Araneus ventricosus TaxID=182803 RepID=A0A4Y2SG65_ARAVE|nr:hypothetical protein AVEN_64254-1 [Araneus ventricosus]
MTFQASTIFAGIPKPHVVYRYRGERTSLHDWSSLGASGQWFASSCPSGYRINAWLGGNSSFWTMPIYSHQQQSITLWEWILVLVGG